jgi:RNA-binding protein Nova
MGGSGYGGYDGGAGGGGGESVTYTVHVPDHQIPAILGRGGASIKEMMAESGASIKVSQKGDYVPGTQNRIITITGSQTAASMAHQLVSAKIPQEY